MNGQFPINRIDVAAYRIPTDFPESDGTFAWDHTTIVVVEAYAGSSMGIGYTYGEVACGRLVDRVFTPLLLGRDAFAITDAWVAMQKAVRNIGRPAIASM